MAEIFEEDTRDLGIFREVQRVLPALETGSVKRSGEEGVGVDGRGQKLARRGMSISC